MIAFKNIKKDFRTKKVLVGVSGIFQEGRTHLVIGGSGTGKTVLLKCIVGLIRPDVGEIYYDDRRFIPKAYGPAEQAIRKDIGMLFQGSALFDSKTVEENVRFPLDILTRMTRLEKKKRVDFCLDRVDLMGTNQRMPSQLSGGMKKRVGIARAIVNKPRYLFCDEPNSGLDPQNALLIDRLIEEITQEYSMITVVITHDMNSVMEIGHRITFLHQGSVHWEGTKDTILHADVAELRDFILSSKLMRALQQSAS